MEWCIRRQLARVPRLAEETGSDTRPCDARRNPFSCRDRAPEYIYAILSPGIPEEPDSTDRDTGGAPVAGNDPGPRRLLDQLIQWKLLRVLAVYAAASWAILEVTDVFIDKLGLPAWFFPAAIILLLIGLVVITATAVVQVGAPLADAGEAPRVAVPAGLPRLTWPRAIVGGVLTFGVLVAAGFWIAGRAGDEGPAAAEAPANAVAVLPFHTTGAGLEVWREGLMDVLTANLDGVGDLRAIDTRTVMSRWRSRIGEEDAPAEDAVGVARELGARWAVYGQAVELGGQVRLDTRLYATETGATVSSSRVEGPPDSILALTEGVTLELLRGLGAEQGLGDQGRAFTATSMEAVRSYLAGVQALRRSDWDGAVEVLEAALAVDSTFAMAALRLSDAYGWRYYAGHPAAAAASAHALRFADRLPARDRAMLEVTRLMDQGRVEAIDRARRLVARYPSDPEAWNHLGETIYHLGQSESIPFREMLAPFERVLALDSTFRGPLDHLTELSARIGDLEAFDRFTRLYLAQDSSSGDAEARRLAHTLVRGSAADSLAAMDRLKDLSPTQLSQIILVLLNPEWTELTVQIGHEMAAPRHAAADRAVAYDFWIQFQEIWRGRPAAAEEAIQQSEALGTRPRVTAYYRLAYLAYGFGDPELGPSAIAKARETGVFERPAGRSMLGVYYLYHNEVTRVPAQADTIDLLADSLRVAGDSIGAERATGLAMGLRGLLAGRRGDHEAAVTALRRAIPQSSGLNPPGWLAMNQQQLGLANSLLELGEEDEALRILEGSFEISHLDAPTSIARGQIYERRGQREDAIRAYSRAVELWRDCDPELRPQWELAQQALERLLAEG